MSADGDKTLEIVRRALAEDVGSGDLTTLALVAEDRDSRAEILACQTLVVCGCEVAEATFQSVDDRVQCDVLLGDGACASPGDVILKLDGPARAILTAERTALNFMQRLSGIATLTQAFVNQAGFHGVTILDTRKTTPTLRALEKMAVRCGGGSNHRMGLYDKIMIKDNHRHLWAENGDCSLDQAISLAREASPGVEIEVEVESLEDLEIALEGKPDWVLLDNMDPEAMRTCVERVAGQCKVEASGGITLDTLDAVAQSGIDAISLGCLTHSAPAADLSLEFVQ
jgi:nicotinate-nucleotide pyrophosphorylase (carboxylating)